MPRLVDELNVVMKPFCEVVKNSNYIPSEYQGLTEGMTGFYSDGRQEAFALNPPIAGVCRNLITEPGIVSNLQPDGDRFILRTIIGYSMAARYITDPVVFTMQIINLINGMTGAAYKVYGPRIRKLYFD